ncbi:hypothetical protein [Deefgea rivuli]|uniref:hypothetical protein n=1 Tax=Deefgea rivuli TaxID=400948 RepID=UPI00055FF356|nr:hypothetical protein [Deefgea rivuli]
MTSPIALAELFFRGEYVYDLDSKTWIEAFNYIDEHAASVSFDKSATHMLWTVNGGHLRNKIRDDALILRVLKKTMPGYQGSGLTLYRGEGQHLYEQQKIGFCWSPDIKVASLFASGLNALESGGVLLSAYAPAEAILTGPNDHSALQMKEFEHTCDPTSLQEIKVLQRFPKLSREDYPLN